MDQVQTTTSSRSRPALLALSVLSGLLLIVSAALVAAYIDHGQQLDLAERENASLRDQKTAEKQGEPAGGTQTYNGKASHQGQSFSFDLPEGYSVVRQDLPESGQILLSIVKKGPDGSWDDTDVRVNVAGDFWEFDDVLKEPYVQAETLRTVRGMRVVNWMDPTRELGGGAGVIIELSPQKIAYISRLQVDLQHESVYQMIVDTIK